MRIRSLALSALALALTVHVAVAQEYRLPANLKSAPAAVVVDRLLAGREALALQPFQVTQLTALSRRLHDERGRARPAAPGKSVPRSMRTRTTAAEAFRRALALLTPDQQARAVQLLETPGR